MIEAMMFNAPPKPPQHVPPQRVPGHDPEDDGGESNAFDDAIAELPELDGEAGSEAHDLDGGEGGPSEVVDALQDDANEEADAELVAEAMIDTLQDIETSSWETAEDEPVDADEELSEGEGESWADDRVDESAFSEEELDRDPATPEDGGEEGFDDDVLSDIDLPTRPEGARPTESTEEDESDIPGLNEWRP